MSDHSSDSSYATPKAAEMAFYTAFVECDLRAMAEVWAEEDVSCIHPGAALLIGREAVLRSWQHILVDALQPRLQVKLLRRTEADTMAVHLVEERISAGEGEAGETAVVLATNVYRRQERGWRLLSHHASLVLSQAPEQEASQPPTLQ